MSKNKAFVITDPSLEPYFIEFDSLSYTALKKVTSSAGRERAVPLGHYSSLSNCLNAIAEDETKNKDYSSVKEFVETFETNLMRIKDLQNTEILK